MSDYYAHLISEVAPDVYMWCVPNSTRFEFDTSPTGIRQEDVSSIYFATNVFRTAEEAWQDMRHKYGNPGTEYGELYPLRSSDNCYLYWETYKRYHKLMNPVIARVPLEDGKVYRMPSKLGDLVVDVAETHHALTIVFNFGESYLEVSFPDREFYLGTWDGQLHTINRVSGSSYRLVNTKTNRIKTMDYVGDFDFLINDKVFNQGGEASDLSYLQHLTSYRGTAEVLFFLGDEPVSVETFNQLLQDLARRVG